MAKKTGKIENKNSARKNSNSRTNSLPLDSKTKIKRWTGAIILFLLAFVITFSFFNIAGIVGEYTFKTLAFLLGEAAYLMPLLLFLTALCVLNFSENNVVIFPSLGLLLLTIGLAAVFGEYNIPQRNGGWLGYIFASPMSKYLGSAVASIIFLGLIAVGSYIFWIFIPETIKELIFSLSREKEEEISGEESALSKRKGGEEKEEKGRTIKGVGARGQEGEEEKIKLKVRTVGKKDNNRRDERKNKSDVLVSLGAKGFMNFDSEYKLPPLKLLDAKEEVPASGDTEHNAIVIKRTFKNFGIEVEMSEVNIGPTVTQYTLKPAEGVKLSKITSLSNNISLALAAHPIRIEAPIPGRPLVGIEVPNKVKAKVKTGNLISLPEFRKYPSPLVFALGKDVMGKPIFADIARMPHLLVAGATGSGKTICLNSLILSLIYRDSPKVLRFILIDPKRVEFSVFNSLPHLLTPVILDVNKAVNALNWLVGEMERRFEVLREAKTRDIEAYNKLVAEKPKLKESGLEAMPYIVLIIDELADLMVAKGREIENNIIRLSQLARAVGIHLILATQRPSVEVITGLIKANITSRISFQVASQVDSRTILDTAGAEKLLGRGDMLFLSSEFSKPKRIQGGFISSAEVKKVVSFIIKENSSNYYNGLGESLENELEKKENEDIIGFSEQDPLYDQAKEIVIRYQKASASLLQRRLRVGYARAARLLDMLEENGIIGPADGAKSREVYLKEDSSSSFDKDF